jgi:hypothetical protein
MTLLRIGNAPLALESSTVRLHTHLKLAYRARCNLAEMPCDGESGMGELKAGGKLKSSVCETQVMIIKSPGGSHELSCGGAPMIGAAEEGSGTLDADKAEGTTVGRRYVNADETLELLCVKGGQGSLYFDGVKLEPKQAKALPSSD